MRKAELNYPAATKLPRRKAGIIKCRCPASGEQSPGLFRSCRGHDRPNARKR